MYNLSVWRKPFLNCCQNRLLTLIHCDTKCSIKKYAFIFVTVIYYLNILITQIKLTSNGDFITENILLAKQDLEITLA